MYAEELREIRRDEASAHRQDIRSHRIDSKRFGLITEHVKYSEDTVSSIALKLKSKGAIHSDSLSVLMYALGEHEKHISVFFQNNGALQGLLRELTGNDGNKQILAAGCLCNLALGPTRTCHSLAKASGAYLITFLQSQNRHLLELCLWTVGNMAASGEKVINLLESQGLFNHIDPLLENTHEPETIDAAAYALSQIILSKSFHLKDEHAENILYKILSFKHKSEQIFWLLYLLSDRNVFKKILMSINSMVSMIVELIEQIKTNKTNDATIIINCLIRIIANLCSESDVFSDDVINILFSPKFIECINILFSYKCLENHKEILWLLGNIYNFSPNIPEKIKFFEEISPLLITSVSD